MRQIILHSVVALLAFTLGIAVQAVSHVFQFSKADKIELFALHHGMREASQPASSRFIEPARFALSSDPGGKYVFAHEAPKGFENISSIYIEPFTEIPEDDFPSGINLSGGSMLSRPQYRMKRMTFDDGDRLSFTTVTIKGVSYQLTGRFLERGIFDEMYDSESSGVVLEGRLTKTRGGRTITESDVSFVRSLSGC